MYASPRADYRPIRSINAGSPTPLSTIRVGRSVSPAPLAAKHSCSYTTLPARVSTYAAPVSTYGYPTYSAPISSYSVMRNSPGLAQKDRCKAVTGKPLARHLSLAKSVAAKGGIAKWNEHSDLAHLLKLMEGACTATTVEEALKEVKSIMSLGHNLWAYMYLRYLGNKNPDLYYSTLLAEPSLLLPVAYTPAVGEGCQKFGLMPMYPRGCYVSITDRGNLKAVLREYAEAMLPKDKNGNFVCQCIVFSDGGRILGLGDLGTFGMGIPLGKLDLYTACGGFDPRTTIPVIIDAGCSDAEGNSAKMVIRDHELYTGLKQDRVKHKSAAGTDVNTAYYGPDSLINEFMSAACELFGKGCLLQFEDFNSNDAFPLLAEYRDKFLCYNDDIQGTASVAVAAVLGGVKIQKPNTSDLIGEARSMRFLFHGSGSANLGCSSLLVNEAGVPATSVFCTNSKGLLWKSADGTQGSFRNDEQKAAAQVGQPPCGSDLVSIIKYVKPDAIIGAVGRDPGCFNKEVIDAMLEVQAAKPGGGMRPLVFALSNPKTQAEITAKQCYDFSKGKAIFGSGTRFDKEMVNGKVREPGQVNNFFIFPGMSFGAMCCECSTIPERLFMVAAEAVANSLDATDISVESVVPNAARCRDVGLAVATAVVWEAQNTGLAGKILGASKQAVMEKLMSLRWAPSVDAGLSSKIDKMNLFDEQQADYLLMGA
eukprot:gnl/TRDRNA2_/TRDRNA2_177127_c0_seq3.p1 gnl/TRDRNA2_/TRDRNA2_177127_c0~~gnl/TRDRNA2_/TRDRNA2_177127_c0_seq3.p1  ORF type:complete len:707 (-),score=129.00 gnl/TRDRNA2_/TRDRNA2_177127_c0_seq3:463-2583(-)